MPVFRVEKNKDFTVMSNHHLRNRQISLRAKGLLSQILSLPPDWDYTLSGLAAINLEGIDAVREAVKELEAAGYVTREQRCGERGRFSGSDYVIREIPLKELSISEHPTTVHPASVLPLSVSPGTGPPTSEHPTELRKEQVKREKSNTDGIQYPIHPITDRARAADQMRKDRALYRARIEANIEYEIIAGEAHNREEIDEVVEIMLDAICSTKPFLVICGEEMPKDVVKSRLLKLNSEHIQYVLDCIRENTTKVRNVKQYILACLYNAPSTMSKESKWLAGMRTKITKKMAVSLLKDGWVFAPGLYSQRKGRCFDANLVLEDTGSYVNLKLDFSGRGAATSRKKGV